MMLFDNKSKTNAALPYFIVAMAVCLTGIALPANAQVTADGTTATHVFTDTDGHVRVEIAPIVANRVSYNRYTNFNVSEAGLDFDNRLVNARTIVNEVTGADPSRIQGAIEVLGQRAHVILANTNGITVDGGQFINTGGVVLSTGEVSFVDRLVGPGLLQINTFLETGEGVIRIEGEGLTGTMDRLDLLAKEIKISAQVLNESEDPRSELAIYAGDSLAEYDSSIVPTNTASRWGTVVGGGINGRAESPNAVLVDITRDASLEAGSVLIEVTDLGAGVRYAGDGLATRRGFNILADGELVFDGAVLTAATGVNAYGSTIEIAGDVEAERRAEFNAAFGAVSLTAHNGDVNITDARLTGFSGFEPAGILGAVNITAENGVVNIGSTHEDYRSDIITFDREDVGLTDDIYITAGHEVTISDTVLSSAADINVSGTQIDIDSDIVQAIVFADGVINLSASDGDITNTGGLVQALGPRGAQSALTINAAGDVINQTLNADHVATFFGQGGLEITSGGRIVNNAARLVSGAHISLIAPDAIDSTINYASGGDAVGAEAADILLSAWEMGGGEQGVDLGELELDGLISLINAAGVIDITTDAFYSRGGDVVSTGAGVNINARTVAFESVYSGAYDFRRSCFIFCRSSGNSDISARGGRLSAAGVINITGAESLDVIGGDISGLGEILLDADRILLKSFPIVDLFERRGGVYNLWAGTSAYITWQDRFGNVTAGGTLTIETDEEVVLDGGQLTAANIVNPAGVRVIRDPDFFTNIGASNIGFLSQIGLLTDSKDNTYEDDSSS
ncbi:MAG: filamentous hemagglutinin N-terminal domain-containing protein [Maricaulaceae bacterium]